MYAMMCIWIFVLVTAIVAEAITPMLVAIWFMPAALVSLILAFCEVQTEIQVLVFFITALGLILVIRPFAKKLMKNHAVTPTNADALIGEIGIVTEPILNLSDSGQVKVKSQIWTARTKTDDVMIPKDALVKVDEIVGVRLICSPAEQETSLKSE